MAAAERTRADVGRNTISAFVTTRGKVLSTSDSVADAQRLFQSRSVHVIPVLDGRRYVGAVHRDAVPPDLPGATSLAGIERPSLPVVRADTLASDALATLDRAGGTRLVVVDARDDYVGLVCLQRDRQRFCIDA